VSIVIPYFLNPYRYYYTVLSGGSIGINSSNPFAPPIIDSGLLTSDFDLFTLREAIKRSYELLSAPVWQDFIIGPTEDLLNLTTEDLNQYIRNSVGSTYHLVGSASMSARDAGYGVVDPDLLVKGASGLRIIDASVLV
jgi:choline dehydrogenase-like flavoprotein